MIMIIASTYSNTKSANFQVSEQGGALNALGVW